MNKKIFKGVTREKIIIIKILKSGIPSKNSFIDFLKMNCVTVITLEILMKVLKNRSARELSC